MKDKINSISAIWISNPKTLEDCSHLVLDFLLLLRKFNSNLFGQWFEKGASRKKSLESEVVLNADYIGAIIEKKWDKKFNDLGSRISFWTGHLNESFASEISIRIGAYGEKPYNRNSCILTLPDEYCDCQSLRVTKDLISK